MTDAQLPEKKLEDLVKEAKEGSKDAFRLIFDRLSNDFFVYILSRTSDRERSLDILQEVFIDLWKGMNRFQYRSDQAFYGFIFSITKRKIFNYYKKKPDTIPLESVQSRLSYSPKQEDHRYLMKQIGRLAEKYQDIIKLRYWFDMSFNEIAFVLNIKETTAKVWHHRALKELRNNFDLKNYAS